MIFFLVLILILIIFTFFGFKGKNLLLTALFLSYLIAIGSMILYIAKDTYYYNLLKNYFYLPATLWKWLFFVGISKMNIIRIMTLSSLSILILSVYFSFSFYPFEKKRTKRIVSRFVWIYCFSLLILYDPTLNLKVYYLLYPDYVSVEYYLKAEQLIFTVTRTVNNLLILISLSIMIAAYRKAPKLKVFRLHYLFLSISYSILSFVYLFFISSVPAFYLNISKISGVLRYRSIPLGSDAFIYNVLPYFLIVSALIVAFCAYRLVIYNNQTQLNEFSLSKEISSSETTSKIFCHYIKNEILAIASEMDMIPQHEDNKELLEDLKKRCDILYSRIDEIHRSTKTSELSLKSWSMQKLLSQTLEEFSFRSDEMKVTCDFPSAEVYALIDPVYMGQAIHNIIINSAEAMADMPESARKLSLKLEVLHPWIQLEITDTGKGISKENLSKVFLHFYSSHPYSKHWGVGLTLTYKIITAHEGKIDVESTPGIGTTMRILLPSITHIK